MKFNSHPPNSVFIKAVTITVSRRAWPAQLYSAVNRHTVQTGRRSWEEAKDGERLRKKRGRTQSVNKASKDLRQSAAKRQRGLISLKGSSASYAI